MPQINDAINAAIPDVVATQNAINDKLLRYYQTNGATSGEIDDAEYQFLVARGEVPAQVNDMWEHYLRVTKGFSGALDDMKYAFWVAGGIP